MGNDDDLNSGIRNLEEILYRLEERANNIEWLKEHARQQAEKSARPVEPRALKVHCPKCGRELEIGDALEGRAPKCPDCDPPPVVQAFAEEMPAKGPEPEAKAEPPVEEPPLKEPEPAAKVTEPEVKVPEPAAKAPEPEIKVPEPAVKAAAPVIKAPEPALKAPEVKVPPAIEPPKVQQPPAAPKPAVKPARKPFILNSKPLIYLFVSLAIAGAGYLLVFNSAAHRYAQAGELVKAARNAEAISAYTKIISQYSGSPEAAYSQFAIGDIKAVQGDIPGAIERYEQFLLAAPAGDAKVPEAKFKIAELEFKEDNFPDAAFMYNNPDIQASGYAKQAQDRLNQIKAVNAQAADAKKLMAKEPAKAVETFSAILAAHPALKTAAAGLEEARKAMAEEKEHPKPRRAARAQRAKPAKSARKAAKTKAAAPMYSRESLDSCNSIWMAEKVMGHLEGDMLAEKTKYNCDALKEELAACKDLQVQFKSIQTLKPEARALMEQGINQNWTVQDQVAQDKKTLKNYEAHHCGEFAKTVPQ